MNLFDTYRGEIIYIQTNSDFIRSEVSKYNDPIILFSFGDYGYEYKEFVNTIKPKNIESMSLMLKRIFRELNNIKNFIVDDAYVMQSLNPTPIGKGAALKGFVSTFSNIFKQSKKTMIFISEDIDHTTARHIKQKIIKKIIKKNLDF